MGESAELGRLGRYYRSLLDLEVDGAPEDLLENALRLLVELVGAREGYLEVEDLGAADSLQWFAAHGCSPERLGEIRRTVSRGIIAQTLASGEVVTTSSAIEDPRFEQQKSVREHEIEAVVCAPVGRGDLRGVVYLQGNTERMPVSEETRQHVAYFGIALTPFLESNLARIRPVIEDRSGGPFGAVQQRSRCMREVVTRLQLAAPLDIDMLFTGPTGVGKSLLARAVHAASSRSAKPFMEINCAALPETLFENELFGAEEGAHSSVPRGGVVGKLEAADGGTLFLDEIAELTLASQAKLLTLLQSRAYYRLGSPRQRHADVRILAATNADLTARMEERAFREDLYYRLNVLEVRVPALSERLDDIPALVATFVRRASERHSLDVRGVSPEALRAVLQARWPGNVRELEHRLESAVVNAHMRGARIVEARDIFERSAETSESMSLQDATIRFQRAHVLAVLEATEWNVSEAARRLDVARSHLYNLIRQHGLERR